MDPSNGKDTNYGGKTHTRRVHDRGFVDEREYPKVLLWFECEKEWCLVRVDDLDNTDYEEGMLGQDVAFWDCKYCGARHRSDVRL